MEHQKQIIEGLKCQNKALQQVNELLESRVKLAEKMIDNIRWYAEQSPADYALLDMIHRAYNNAK